jgi:hypothetical protein
VTTLLLAVAVLVVETLAEVVEQVHLELEAHL